MMDITSCTLHNVRKTIPIWNIQLPSVYIIWNSLLQYSCSCYHVEDITELKECRSHPHTFTRRVQLCRVKLRYIANPFHLFIMFVKELCWLFFRSLHVLKMSVTVTVTHCREQVFLTTKKRLYLRYRGQMSLSGLMAGLLDQSLSAVNDLNI